MLESWLTLVSFVLSCYADQIARSEITDCSQHMGSSRSLRSRADQTHQSHSSASLSPLASLSPIALPPRFTRWRRIAFLRCFEQP